VLTYEYECRSCGHRFEHRQAITEAPVAACPVCGSHAGRLLSAGAGILVKGSGQRSGRHAGGGCSLEGEGTTCCGRQERCDKPPCSGNR
jgi:putative FmdB family regulatory protein